MEFLKYMKVMMEDEDLLTFEVKEAEYTIAPAL